MDAKRAAKTRRVKEVIGILGPINYLDQTCLERTEIACPDTRNEPETEDLMVAFSLDLGAEVTGRAAKNERSSEWKR
jgi:hypothetical protein